MSELTRIVEAVAGGPRQAPGVSVAVVRGDEVVASAAAGYADLASATPMSVGGACNWFSMTKIATATATMVLAEAGSLDIDARVGRYLGERWPSVLDQVLVRHLLSHSGGLRNPIPIRWVHRAGEPGPDPSAFLARVLARQRRPRSEPGAAASYSNIGYLALGEIITTVAGRPYESFVAEELLRPLGMTQTTFSWKACTSPRVTAYQRLPRVLAPALKVLLPQGLLGVRSRGLVALHPFEVDGAAYGGLIGPVTDAARLVALFANRGTANGARLLRQETYDAMTTLSTPGRPYDVGLGWRRPHDATIGVEHLGGGMGYWNALRLLPHRGAGAAVMSNITRHWDIVRVADASIDIVNR
jgi:CubicO group peptidase (beta-lactamase class C family)